MPEKKCLNCNYDIENNFCSHCGQKTSTHQFSWKYFLINDFIYGAFKLEKGFFFTIKELFTRPGHSIREYVKGKRVHHFNYFSLLLVILAINHFIGNYSSVRAVDLYGADEVTGYLKISRDYNAIIKILYIPFWSVVTFLFFRKSKQKYIENIVMNMYMMCGLLTIYLLFSLLTVFYANVEGLKTIKSFIPLFTLLYFTYFLYQYFSVFQYNKFLLLFRILLVALILMFIQSSVIKTINEIGELFF
ncbi:DUF3667 domain-containing protein [uncultured Aquimarina sp.]|uniref:DUF3667 domain-containing protein n=1 Tax=uncultured Aquimarina sp. TaxID=575652 RepID=UPI00261E3E06|nr:DUF3667 domain-containing protein [uncultured Aquimarina sp.]